MPTHVCPGCRQPLEAIHPEGVWDCSSCGGKLVELEALKAVGVRLPRESTHTLPRKPRHCGACSSAMDTVVLAHITLDVCEDCSAVYFDAGELELVRAAVPQGATTPCGGCGGRFALSLLRRRGAQLLCSECRKEEEDPSRLQPTAADYQHALAHASAEQKELAWQERYGATAFVQGGPTLDLNDGGGFAHRERHRQLNEDPGTGRSLFELLWFLFG